MGLIKALTGSVSGVLADQWKEYIRCEDLGQDILMKLGELYQFESGIYGYGNLWTKLERIIENNRKQNELRKKEEEKIRIEK